MTGIAPGMMNHWEGGICFLKMHSIFKKKKNLNSFMFYFSSSKKSFVLVYVLVFLEEIFIDFKYVLQ